MLAQRQRKMKSRKGVTRPKRTGKSACANKN
jgi:hypothetical protein